MSSSFTRLLRVPFTTKRNPGLVEGKRLGPQLHLAGDTLRCTPLDPADGEAARDVAVRLKDVLKGPYRILETFVAGDLDIAEGDLLIVAGRAYPIRQINRWEWDADEVYLHLLLEENRA